MNGSVNGCVYCKDEKRFISRLMITPRGEEVYLDCDIAYGSLHYDLHEEIRSTAYTPHRKRINFCPMCGRQLHKELIKVEEARS